MLYLTSIESFSTRGDRVVVYLRDTSRIHPRTISSRMEFTMEEYPDPVRDSEPRTRNSEVGVDTEKVLM